MTAGRAKAGALMMLLNSDLRSHCLRFRTIPTAECILDFMCPVTSTIPPSQLLGAGDFWLSRSMALPMPFGTELRDLPLSNGVVSVSSPRPCSPLVRRLPRDIVLGRSSNGAMVGIAGDWSSSASIGCRVSGGDLLRIFAMIDGPASRSSSKSASSGDGGSDTSNMVSDLPALLASSSSSSEVEMYSRAVLTDSDR